MHSVVSDCDTANGAMCLTVELPASPDRVFRALASKEIIDWWVRPGVFDTREWSGEVRPGGRWSASGFGGGKPYTLDGKFTDVDAPGRLAHTWHLARTPAAPTAVFYDLERTPGGTRLTLRHEGFTTPEGCTNTCIGWKTSLEQLTRLLANE